MELPFPEIIYDIGEPSSFPYMETATTELPLPQTTYETGGPSSFPAYAPGGSTYFGDPYATQSFPYGQGSEMFTGAEDGYVDPHGYPYHTTTYLGGSDLYPRCFVCGEMGHLTAVCPRYVELLEIPYLPCARPAGGSMEWGRCPNCAMDENLKVKRVQGQKPKTRRERGKEDSETGPWYGLDNGQRQGFISSVFEEGEFEKRSRGIFGHIGRSPGCDVDTTGPMPYRLDDEDNCVECVLCRQQVRNPPMLGMFWGGLVFPRLVPSGFKETPYSLDREDLDERGHVLWLSITRRCNVAGIFGHIGRSPGCDVDTTGAKPAHARHVLGCPCLAWAGFASAVGITHYGFKETPYSLDREDSDERGHVLWLTITRRCNVAVT
ncbi:hypothetical protein YC2023_082562 [Brassica napus]